jgi:hypothetical protein
MAFSLKDTFKSIVSQIRLHWNETFISEAAWEDLKAKGWQYTDEYFTAPSHHGVVGGTIRVVRDRDGFSLDAPGREDARARFQADLRETVTRLAAQNAASKNSPSPK